MSPQATKPEEGRTGRHEVDAWVEGAALLKAMAHPLRLAILSSLSESALCVHELVGTTGATQPLVSQHLRVLRSAELVIGEQRGREVVYAIADDHIRHIVADALDHARTEGISHEPHVH